MPGEGLVALLVQGQLPGTEQGLSDVQGASGLSHGAAFFCDQLDRLELELARVGATLSCHDGPPAVSLHRYLGVHRSWGGSDCQRGYQAALKKCMEDWDLYAWFFRRLRAHYR